MKKFLTVLLITVLAICMLVASACTNVSFKLAFVVDGETYATIETSGSETITVPENPVKDGYTFDGWFWDDGVWEKPFTANSLLDAPITSDMKVYAKFDKIHTYAKVVTSPTCTEKGYTTYTCECGDSYVDDYVDALGHSHTSSVTSPTCTESGYTTYTCECGDSYVDDEVNALGHDQVSHSAKPADCQTLGYNAYVTCSRCDYSTFEEIAYTAHSYSGRTCTVCSDLKPSVGLEFVSENNDTEYWVNIGTCTDTKVSIPSTYNDLPVTNLNYYFLLDNTTVTHLQLGKNMKDISDLCDKTTIVSITVDRDNPNFKSVDGVLYSKDGTVLYRYPAGKTATSFTIPNTVTKIEEDAFYYNAYLRTITFEQQSQCREIGTAAFRNCTALMNITIPNTVEKLGTRTFYYCTALQTITIPNSVSDLGNGATFDYCSSLRSVTFEQGSQITVLENTFYGCTLLDSVAIPDSVTTMYFTFYECTNLQNVTFGENSKLELIGGYAFYKCSNLTSVSIPSKVKTIEHYAFYYCTKLSVSFDANGDLETIGQYAFTNCDNITSFVAPNKLKIIDESAFINCDKLASVHISSSVDKIGWNAFVGCIHLNSAVFEYNYWRYKGNSLYKNGTDVSVTNASTNAANLRNSDNRYWYAVR